MKRFQSILRTVVCLLLLGAANRLYAQSIEFVENKGQWDSRVRYKGELLTGAFFLQAQGYRVLQHNKTEFQDMIEIMHGHKNPPASDAARNGKPGTSTWETVHSHAYDVIFDQSNTNPTVINERPAPGTSNYFIGNDKSKWASDCKTYGSLLYKDVYPGIDVRYYSDNGFLKYDLIVHPNASLAKLGLRYEGVDGLSLKDGNLLVKTSVGEIKEQYPYTYQLQNGVKTEIKCSYKLIGNTVKFSLGQYDPSQTLIIDPTLVFSTFTGSPANNWGYTATYDAGGNLYAGGIVFGNGYPTTAGAFQSNFGGGNNSSGEGGNGYDIGIMKFSADGRQRIYATYLGGNSNEAPHSLIVDAQNNLVMAGRTLSANYPTNPGFVRGPGGGWDIVVTKLNAAGSALIGSCRIGGSADDGVNIRNKYPSPSPNSLMVNYGDDSRSEVVLDGANNIYLASCTRSANFPLQGGFQTTLSGQQDALILKFAPDLSSLTFATLLGGSGDDAAYVVEIGGGGLLIGGGTNSSDFPGNKAGTVGPSARGAIDGFLAMISTDGSALQRSTYIGTGGNDQVYGVQYDQFGFPYIMGTSTGSFPVQNAAFSSPNGKQFIAKLQPDFSAFVYSTVFGSGESVPNISPTAMLVDRCQNVYVSGWGGRITEPPATPFPLAGTLGLPVTSDALQNTTDDDDFYFFVLEKDATRQLYGTFFGQRGGFTDHVDGGTSRFDRQGIIYQAVCANCGAGAQYPVTPGVVGPSNAAGQGCNEAVMKIAFNFAGITNGVKAAIGRVDGDTSGCVPVTVRFRDTVQIALRYEWNFGDGSPDQTTTLPEITHTYNAVGSYLVRLIGIDSTKCFPRDTSYVTIIVREDIAPLNARAVKLPPCTSNSYRFDNLTIPYVSKPFKANSFTWIWGDNSPNTIAGANSVNHTFPGIGTYNVKLVLTDTNYCNAPDTFPLTVRVNPNVDARIDTDLSGCVPYNAVFDNVSLGGTDFTWDFGDGTTSTDASPTHLYTIPGTYIVKLTAIDSGTCNIIDSATVTIVVSDIPTAAFTFAPNPPIENILTTFTNLSENATRYKWLFGDGDSLNTVRRDTTVRHQYNETGTFNACLIAYNQFGCPDTTCQPVRTIVNPLLDVPNAFTPNGDGVNDRAVVIGFGIAKMDFRIYNRQGLLMFRSNDRRIGWNGIFQGKAQPMDVYAYTLDVEFVDGKKLKKKGDITLLR